MTLTQIMVLWFTFGYVVGHIFQKVARRARR